MALAPIPRGIEWATGSIVPVNGINVIPTGLSVPRFDPNWLRITATPLGPSVTGATFVAAASDCSTVTLNIAQAGVDGLELVVEAIHSVIR